ncbi:tyrosine-protein phosphatase [Sporobolomyces koalae]|uniref:tyrosine-protein phosphatase n=1 Tax=Sporobolomyces koalae TaxID=500713 RepID=UPI003178AEDD
MALSIPACLNPSRAEFATIFQQLAMREHARRALAQGADPASIAPLTSSGNTPDDRFAMSVGTSRAHMKNNRYGDIVAYDSTRITLPDPYYVNASLIREPEVGFDSNLVPRRFWIAAQGPIESTIPSFLSLLLDPPASLSHPDPKLARVKLIVQLTPLVEQHREKCAPYFPSDHPGEEWLWSSEDRQDGGTAGVWVRFEGRDETNKIEGERKSWLRVGKDGDETGRRVLHVEYLGWRDHGVPASPSHLLSFIQRMNQLNAKLSSESTTTEPSTDPAPILLHCSAGVGRTGTYLAISSLLPLLDHLESTPSSPVPPRDVVDRIQETNPTSYPFEQTIQGAVDHVGLTVDGIRDQRTTMVQTKEQLAFVYEALRVAWTERSTT